MNHSKGQVLLFFNEFFQKKKTKNLNEEHCVNDREKRKSMRKKIRKLIIDS